MGKTLLRIHRYNAWVVIWLAVTGVMLYLPQLRGILAIVRVPLKWVHIGIGVVSILILLSYIPYLQRHWQTLRKEASRRSTIIVALVLVGGWAVSGVLLWWERSLPPTWATGALWIHDALTWVGVPWMLGHIVVSTRRQEARRKKGQSAKADVIQEWWDHPSEVPMSRRTFMRIGVTTATVVGLGVPVYMLLKKMMDSGGAGLGDYTSRNANPMQPAAVPAPDSVKVVGGGANGHFRVYTVTDIPQSTPQNWSFFVKGLVQKPIEVNWEQFLTLKRTVQVSDFHCVTGWSVYHVTWEGIPLKQLLDQVGVQNSGKFVKFYSGDRVYTDALSLEQASMDDVMVAVLMDGQPIPAELGGPVRLIVPKMYAYKSVKWLQGIEVIEKPHLGYWEVRGYSNDAWVKG